MFFLIIDQSIRHFGTLPHFVRRYGIRYSGTNPMRFVQHSTLPHLPLQLVQTAKFPSAIFQIFIAKQPRLSQIVTSCDKYLFMSAQELIEIPKHHQHMYIHCKNRSLIQSLVLMCLAVTVNVTYVCKTSVLCDRFFWMR